IFLRAMSFSSLSSCRRGGWDGRAEESRQGAAPYGCRDHPFHGIAPGRGRPCSLVALAAVQPLLGLADLAGQQQRKCIRSFFDRRVKRPLLVEPGPRQHVIDHLVLMTGMADTDAQPPEVRASKGGDDVTQAVMAAVTAALLEAQG